MDGYHLTRAQLDASEDPAAMHQRRGAHWTFDARGFVDAARRLKPAAGRELRWPGFDHGVGDPEPDKLCVEADCEVVIVEGNYLLLDEPVWAELGEDVFIERWFVRVDVDEAMRRVCARHIETGKSAVVAAARTIKAGRSPPSLYTARTRALLLHTFARVCVCPALPPCGGTCGALVFVGVEWKTRSLISW